MDKASIELFQTLLPHAHIALQIHAKLQAENIRSRFAELTLSTMSMAVFLVSAGGRVQYMNQLALTRIERRDGLLLKRAALTASNPNENAELKLLIKGAISVGVTKTHAVPGGAMTRQRSDLEQWCCR